MSIAMSIHNIDVVTAAARNSDGTHWVRLDFLKDGRGQFELTTFFRDEEAGRAFAEAINSAKQNAAHDAECRPQEAA